MRAELHDLILRLAAGISCRSRLCCPAGVRAITFLSYVTGISATASGLRMLLTMLIRLATGSGTIMS
jgi:hypothetical protein